VRYRGRIGTVFDVSVLNSQKAKAAIRDVANKRYGTARALYHLTLRRSDLGDPILIYTVGKVGSRSVVSALRASELARPVHHVHWLTDTKLADASRGYREGARRYRGTDKSRRFLQRFIWLGEFLNHEIAQADRVWTVVTLVRDPVARNVSSFFQNIGRFYDFWPMDELEHRDTDDVARELVDLFLESYPTNSTLISDDGDPLVWFDEELKAVFDVDVYAGSFPAKVGFRTYSSATANVLLIRVEDLDRVASHAFGSFLGASGVTVERRNDSLSKPYSAVYRRFRELLVMPEDYLDRLYTSRYATHFYTEAETAAFRDRW